LKVLLYEFVSGGGYADQPVPSSLLSEGYAMLRGLTEDFQAAGHHVTAVLDSRLAQFKQPMQPDQILPACTPDGLEETLQKTLGEVEAAYIIAPEDNELLKTTVQLVEDYGLLSLNCPSLAIVPASDKAAVAERAKTLGLNIPKTLQFKTTEHIELIVQAVKANFGFPAVIKPLTGAGCGGISLVQDASELEQAIDNLIGEIGDCAFCVQEYVEGVPASVSLLCNGAAALPLSLNLQDITLASPDGVSTYNGGIVPLSYPLQQEAFAAAKRLAESFGSLRGYVGVDLILGEDKVFVMEVNPRLTTSYIGLRKVADLNLAHALIQTAQNQLPVAVNLKGVCCFSKVPIARPIIFAWEEFVGMAEMVAPPFPLAGQEVSYGLIQACGDTAQAALHELGHVKERLQAIWEKGQHPW
jgi:predicted ATP-grasp superfamily ATP-dependent carboligase